MDQSLAKLVISVLKKHPGKVFTAKEIAIFLWENYRDEFTEKRNNPRFTSDNDLITQITAEIGSKKDLILKDKNVAIQDQARPKEYCYLTSTRMGEIESIPDITINEELKERDLYPKLSQYLLNECNILSKRINEQKSKNNRGINGNMWLHPDIVGIQPLNRNWNQLIKDCVKGSGSNKLRISSYEVKSKITASNLRESFFQAVSNSSWANQGFLVASELDSRIFDELQMLSSLHGIGFILLNITNPSESQILLQARDKETVDWASANRLVDQNPDFMEFFQSIKVYYDSDVINKKDWWKSE